MSILCHFLCLLLPKFRPSPASALCTRASSERLSIELVTVDDGGCALADGVARPGAGAGGAVLLDGVGALAEEESRRSVSALPRPRDVLRFRSLLGEGPVTPRFAGLFGEALDPRAESLRVSFSLRSPSVPLPCDLLVSLPEPEVLELSA